MDRHVVAARDLVTHLDRALVTRRLYAPGSSPFREVMNLLWERFQLAAEEGDITLVFTPTEIRCDGELVWRRDRREDAFHFPLYRDGLRELRLASDTPRAEIDRLVTVFEAERLGLVESTEDTVGYLWRCDLDHVSYSAVDGIGDIEADGDDLQGLVGNDFQSLVADLTAQVQSPAAPVTGQSYAFVLDADVELARTDFHYEPEAERVDFESQATVFRLTEEEAARLRTESGEESEAEKLERFVEILFAILADPETAIPGRKLAPVLTRILEGYWKAEDALALQIVLERLEEATNSSPIEEKRQTAQGVLASFLSTERLRETVQRIGAGTLSEKAAAALWRRAGDEGWRFLFRVWAKGEPAAARAMLEGHLRRRLVDRPELLREVFADEDPERVKAGLELLGDRALILYSQEVLALADHPAEPVRARAIGQVGKVGGTAAEAVLWKAVEKDPSPAVRLIALRRLVGSLGPAVATRLLSLITRDEFVRRPMWERVRFVGMLGGFGGAVAEQLFHSWIPQKWFWQSRDFEAAELGLRGLLASGQRGLEHVRALTASRSPAAKIARRLLLEAPIEEEDTAALELLADDGGAA